METIDKGLNVTTPRWMQSTVPFYVVYRKNVMAQVSPNFVVSDVDSPDIETPFADVWVCVAGVSLSFKVVYKV